MQRKLRAEQRGLDREIRQIDQSIAKAKTEIRRLARKGDVQNSTVLAKEVVRSNKHKTKLTTSKALLNSISLQLQQQLCTRTQLTPAMLHVTGHLQSSTEIMKLSNRLIKIPQLSQSMREMSAELMKVCVATDAQAGILEEMMQDMLDTSVLNEDPDAMEEEAQAEVDEVLYDLTNGASAATDARSTRPSERASRGATLRGPSGACPRRVRRRPHGRDAGGPTYVAAGLIGHTAKHLTWNSTS